MMKKYLPFILCCLFCGNKLSAQDSLRFLSATTGAAAYEVTHHSGYLYVGSGNTFFVMDARAGNLPPYAKTFAHRFSSNIDDIQIRGNTLYIAANHAGVSKWNLADPAQPAFVTNFLPRDKDESAYDIAVKGDTLFVAMKDKVIVLRDRGNSLDFITDFAQQTLGRARIRGGEVKDNIYAFTLATLSLFPPYAADGVYIYDANTLQQLSYFPEDHTDHEDVVFGQNTPLLHILGGTRSTSTAEPIGLFYSLDISDPTQPRLVFADTISGIIGLAIPSPMNAEIVNDTLYLATQAALDDTPFDSIKGQVYIYALTDPSDLHRIAFVDVGLWHFDLSMQGKIMHVASEWFGIRSLDVSDPQNPIKLGDTHTGGWNTGSDIHGDRLVVANDGYGIKLFDISDKRNPQLIAEHILLGKGFAMNVKFSEDGKYIFAPYFTFAFDGLHVFDGNTLQELGSLAPFTGFDKLEIWDNKLIAKAIPPNIIPVSNLSVVDLQDPIHPTLDTMFQVSINDLLVDNGILFLSNNQFLKIYNLQTSASVKEMNALPVTQGKWFQAMAKYKDTLYVYVRQKGLVRYIFDPTTNNLTEDAIAPLLHGSPKVMAVDSLGLYVGYDDRGIFLLDKNTFAIKAFYLTPFGFYAPGLWGLQDIQAKGGLVMVVDYFGQTTLLTSKNGSLTAIKNPLSENQTLAFPNPISRTQKLRIERLFLDQSVCVFSIKGELCSVPFSKTASHFILDLEALKAGIYIWVVEGETIKSGKIEVF